MSFHVGQQVVCISVKWLPGRNELWYRTIRTFPKLNGVYTIREIRVVDDLIGFCFEEFVNPCAYFSRGYLEPCFKSQNFRPVRKTSISVFERLLAPVDDSGARRKERRREKVSG
jgi:hypothetical protein